MAQAPAPVWLFDRDAMQPGDIVLERGRGAGSALVAEVTNGHYSHALMWVGGGNFIEAMPGGTRSISYVRVPVVARENWRLLRVAPGHELAAAKAADAARSLAFNCYDLEGAVRSVFAPRSEPKASHRFCSQVVAEAYEAAGLALFVSRAPGSIYPNLLLTSALLHDEPLPLIPAGNLVSAPYPTEMLDRSDAFRGTAMDKEGDLTRALFSAVSSLVTRENLPPPLHEQPIDVLNDVLSVLPYMPPEISRDIADRLLKEMQQRGYFNLLAPMIAQIWFDVDPATWWKARADLWRETAARHRTNAEQCLRADTQMPHALWGRLRAMYALNAMAFEGLLEKAREA